MKQEIAERWVAALRSGKYKQCRSRLTTVLDDGQSAHCCLGVLCELAVDAGVTQRGTATVDSMPAFVYGEQAYRLPATVRVWADMSSDDGTLPPGMDFRDDIRRYRSLAYANDDGMSFEAIADVVDAHKGVL